jgi:hypothetical protein
MDKSTLSNYGWIVVVTLVLAVMLALATPFGDYVGQGASEILKSYATASNNAVNPDNIETQSKDWDIYLNNNEKNHTVVADNAIYTDINGKTYTTGAPIPTKAEIGDTYECGSYIYEYVGITDKWKVSVKSKDQVTYEPFLEAINGEPIFSALSLFDGCTKLEYLPEGFTVPEGIYIMQNFFRNCSSLKTIPSTFKIPSTARLLANMFKNCTSLESLPETFVIPSTVGVVNYMFEGCSNLTGNIYFENSPNTDISASNIFRNTVKPITFYIPSSQSQSGLNLKNNPNVTLVIYS